MFVASVGRFVMVVPEGKKKVAFVVPAHQHLLPQQPTICGSNSGLIILVRAVASMQCSMQVSLLLYFAFILVL